MDCREEGKAGRRCLNCFCVRSARLKTYTTLRSITFYFFKGKSGDLAGKKGRREGGIGPVFRLDLFLKTYKTYCPIILYFFNGKSGRIAGKKGRREGGIGHVFRWTYFLKLTKHIARLFFIFLMGRVGGLPGRRGGGKEVLDMFFVGLTS